jgi:hypothetical protein
MACGGRVRAARRGVPITKSVGSLSSESSGAVAAATATALCTVVSSFAGVFTPPRGDVLLAWMVMQPLCACAWTTATMRTFSTDLPSPGQPGPRQVDLTPGSFACVCYGTSRNRAIRWGGVLPSPVVNSLRVPAALACHITVAQRLRVQPPPTFPYDGCPLHQRHAVALDCTHRMPDYVSVCCALHQQRLSTAQVPLEQRAYLLAFSYPLSERKSDAAV